MGIVDSTNSKYCNYMPKYFVLALSTWLGKKLTYIFLLSMLMLSTAVLEWTRCDALYYLAVLSFYRISISEVKVTTWIGYKDDVK